MFVSLPRLAALVALALFSHSSFAQSSVGYSLDLQWSADGFAMPESVVAISGHPWIYVSNVNGDEAPGFISRLNRDGTLDALKWVDGIQTPTGMAAFDGSLYVVDQSQVHKIDIENAKITETFKSAEATSLNDIDISTDGEIYISALAGKSIHKVVDKTIELWVESEQLPAPNGVLVHQDALYVGNIGERVARDLTPDEYGTMVRIAFDTKAVEPVSHTSLMGTWDGLAPFSTGFIASSPFNGQLWYFSDTDKSLLGVTEGGIADVGTDPDDAVVYAPLLFAGKVAAYRLNEFEWHHVTDAGEFSKRVVGQYFGDEAGASVAKSDGTIEGNFSGKTLSGTWAWEGEYFCRESQLGDIDLGSDCIVIELTENKMRLTLDKGKGTSVIYRKQP